jgi:hypothetical protein
VNGQSERASERTKERGETESAKEKNNLYFEVDKNK